jgi:hypothetical protein
MEARPQPTSVDIPSDMVSMAQQKSLIFGSRTYRENLSFENKKTTADFEQKRVVPTTIVKVPSYRWTAEFLNKPPDWSVHFHIKIWSKSGGFLTRLTRFSRHNMTRFSPELSEGRFY